MTHVFALILAACVFESPESNAPPLPIATSGRSEQEPPAESADDVVDEAIRLTQAPAPVAPNTPASPATRPPGFLGGRRPTTPETQPPAVLPRTTRPYSPGGTALLDPNLFAQTEGATQPLGTGSRGGIPQMIGDQSPPTLMIRAAATIPQPPAVPQPFPPTPPPVPPSPRAASALVPSVRGFKIGENQSPQPQDRLFFSSNYFSNVNATVNRRLEAPVSDLKVYRQIFGFEKTFDEGRGSIGLRLPLNTLYGASNIQGSFAKPGGTSTALGDLSIFSKYILRQNSETGSLISAGFVVTPPTGSKTFANANFIQGLHTTSFQPFLGYIYNKDNFYLHGFTAIDAPVSPNDVMLLYNDIGIGYFIVRSQDSDDFITAIAPTFEVHCNIPLNHRDAFSKTDIAGSADVVNLTYGINFEFKRTSVLTFGFVNPVTSPKPFDFEALVLFNFRFGGSRTRPQNLPILGG